MQVVRCRWTDATETAAARATSSTLRHTHAQTCQHAHTPNSFLHPCAQSTLPFPPFLSFLVSTYCLSVPLLSALLLSSPTPCSPPCPAGGVFLVITCGFIG